MVGRRGAPGYHSSSSQEVAPRFSFLPCATCSRCKVQTEHWQPGLHHPFSLPQGTKRLFPSLELHC